MLPLSSPNQIHTPSPLLFLPKKVKLTLSLSSYPSLFLVFTHSLLLVFSSNIFLLFIKPIWLDSSPSTPSLFKFSVFFLFTLFCLSLGNEIPKYIDNKVPENQYSILKKVIFQKFIFLRKSNFRNTICRTSQNYVMEIEFLQDNFLTYENLISVGKNYLTEIQISTTQISDK